MYPNTQIRMATSNTLRLDTVAEARTTVGKTVGLARKGLTLSISGRYSWRDVDWDPLTKKESSDDRMPGFKHGYTRLYTSDHNSCH